MSNDVAHTVAFDLGNRELQSEPLKRLLNDCDYFTREICTYLITIDNALNHGLCHKNFKRVAPILAARFIEVKLELYFTYVLNLDNPDHHLVVKILDYDNYFTKRFQELSTKFSE